ncbi:MAG: ABC transporter ATP-binding protein [Syntrophomonadaceae bacterium]|nr:ABC transporter ATP-binding protein [Syntrophomonadaceae bacterium]
MLKISNLNACYGDVQILYDINLEVNDKEIVTILGSNGAGKTTLMKTICGVETKRSGMIEFDGENLMKVPTHKLVTKGITLTPEGRHLFPELTVEENLLLGAYAAKDKKAAQATYDWVLSLFPRLKERLIQYAGTMSGGEQQMCAIGRVLMSNPKFLMLDEPSLGLAPNIVDAVFDVIKKINQEKGITVMVVEQNANIALQIADRGYVLENGAINMAGSAQDMLASPDIQKLYLGL